MLNKILETKKEEIEKIVLPEKQEVKKFSFYEALVSSTREVALIAEVKKASPSKGVIKEDFNHLNIASQYDRAGADAISVLTDRQYFQGNPQYLIDIKKKINRPVLRKDFIIHSLQVEESARMGADAILLIGEALEPSHLQELYSEAMEKEIECLVEVHSLDVLERLLKVFQPKIIGINNRDLSTFYTSLDQTVEMAKHIPDGSLLVSESGIHQYEHVQKVREAGAKAILVGESLMRKENQEEAIQQLFGETKHAHS